MSHFGRLHFGIVSDSSNYEACARNSVTPPVDLVGRKPTDERVKIFFRFRLSLRIQSASQKFAVFPAFLAKFPKFSQFFPSIQTSIIAMPGTVGNQVGKD